jgi:hypothetical protein
MPWSRVSPATTAAIANTRTSVELQTGRARPQCLCEFPAIDLRPVERRQDLLVRAMRPANTVRLNTFWASTAAYQIPPSRRGIKSPFAPAKADTKPPGPRPHRCARVSGPRTPIDRSLPAPSADASRRSGDTIPNTGSLAELWGITYGVLASEKLWKRGRDSNLWYIQGPTSGEQSAWIGRRVTAAFSMAEVTV